MVAAAVSAADFTVAVSVRLRPLDRVADSSENVVVEEVPLTVAVSVAVAPLAKSRGPSGEAAAPAAV